MYPDDGLAAVDSSEVALLQSREVRNDLYQFGFFSFRVKVRLVPESTRVVART